VFTLAGRMFPLSQLGADSLRVSLKCEPELAEVLRAANAAVRPGYHLNKRRWNTVVIDGSLPDDTIRDMIEAPTTWSLASCRAPGVALSAGAATPSHVPYPSAAPAGRAWKQHIETAGARPQPSGNGPTPDTSLPQESERRRHPPVRCRSGTTSKSAVDTSPYSRARIRAAPSSVSAPARGVRPRPERAWRLIRGALASLP
jgi:YjbR